MMTLLGNRGRCDQRPQISLVQEIQIGTSFAFKYLLAMQNSTLMLLRHFEIVLAERYGGDQNSAFIAKILYFQFNINLCFFFSSERFDGLTIDRGTTVANSSFATPLARIGK